MTIKRSVALLSALGLLFFPAIGQATEIESPTITSETAIVIDAKSGDVIYDKQAEQQMFPASITKILTAIIALEYGEWTDSVEISEAATEAVGTTVFLMEGEVIELGQLIKGLLINSGNDAGVAIAEHLAGSEEAFQRVMNEYLTERIGVENTHFTNAHGLFDEDHYTTAEDMAIITQYAMNNDAFRELAAIEEFEWESESWETTIYNHHQLVRDHDEVIGVKNGFVSQSGFTLATMAEIEDDEYIVVTMNALTANDSYEDTRALLRYAGHNYETQTLEEGDFFEGDDGKEYEVVQGAYYTVARGDEVSHEVDEGQLVIRDAEDDVLVRQTLRPMLDSFQVQAASETVTEEEDQQFSFVQWVQDLIGRWF
ncbi:D-alanyl-D-alanine carboxypeptidase [Geomicrobium sp. JCM 19037]|uniref:D-alanyl-D-alanine carboxypeptidase family protein n=1 Tax=Geomicrobium sp. JCM 19037 TaxID=1460634 RepID=UPI00045F49AC|nr:D-alanyl-D-alanine carboxypeptidase family protein [Geomicrobium sp. JCM 19037]GAK03970.1 D-alanyl-D-alanine carboxypeptidase [Geomicrobium sp. JCM 19037]